MSMQEKKIVDVSPAWCPDFVSRHVVDASTNDTVEQWLCKLLQNSPTAMFQNLMVQHGPRLKLVLGPTCRTAVIMEEALSANELKQIQVASPKRMPPLKDLVEVHLGVFESTEGILLNASDLVFDLLLESPIKVQLKEMITYQHCRQLTVSQDDESLPLILLRKPRMKRKLSIKEVAEKIENSTKRPKKVARISRDDDKEESNKKRKGQTMDTENSKHQETTLTTKDRKKDSSNGENGKGSKKKVTNEAAATTEKRNPPPDEDGADSSSDSGSDSGSDEGEEQQQEIEEEVHEKEAENKNNECNEDGDDLMEKHKKKSNTNVAPEDKLKDDKTEAEANSTIVAVDDNTSKGAGAKKAKPSDSRPGKNKSNKEDVQLPEQGDKDERTASKESPDGDSADEAVLDKDAYNFVKKLYNILMKEKYAKIIRWQDHGLAWRVMNKAEFESTFLTGEWSKFRNYTSFSRDVKKAGFQVIKSGPDRYAWYHKSFTQGNPKSLRKIENLPKKELDTLVAQGIPDLVALSTGLSAKKKKPSAAKGKSTNESKTDHNGVDTKIAKVPNKRINSKQNDKDAIHSKLPASSERKIAAVDDANDGSVGNHDASSDDSSSSSSGSSSGSSSASSAPSGTANADTKPVHEETQADGKHTLVGKNVLIDHGVSADIATQKATEMESEEQNGTNENSAKVTRNKGKTDSTIGPRSSTEKESRVRANVSTENAKNQGNGDDDDNASVSSNGSSSSSSSSGTGSTSSSSSTSSGSSSTSGSSEDASKHGAVSKRLSFSQADTPLVSPSGKSGGTVKKTKSEVASTRNRRRRTLESASSQRRLSSGRRKPLLSSTRKIVVETHATSR